MANYYEQQATNFLKKCGAKMTISHITKMGEWLKSEMTGGYLYRIRIDRKGKSWTFKFSDSLSNMWRNKRPSRYDVLTCIAKYEPYGDVWDFASEYGYEITDRESFVKVNHIFNAVKKEYTNVIRMFGDCLDELCEIQ